MKAAAGCTQSKGFAGESRIAPVMPSLLVVAKGTEHASTTVCS